MPPPRTRVICLDEMGPLAVKTYPGEEWLQGAHRATFEPDYGRRGKLWVHGAFEPATGQAAILTSPRRDSLSYIRLVETVIGQFPADVRISNPLWLLVRGLPTRIVSATRQGPTEGCQNTGISEVKRKPLSGTTGISLNS